MIEKMAKMQGHNKWEFTAQVSFFFTLTCTSVSCYASTAHADSLVNRGEDVPVNVPINENQLISKVLVGVTPTVW